jgi:hypothetical protein
VFTLKIEKSLQRGIQRNIAESRKAPAGGCSSAGLIVNCMIKLELDAQDKSRATALRNGTHH